MKALGIYREALHSPDRESDDAQILSLTGKRLGELGLEADLRKPEEVLGMAPRELGSFGLIFMMCEQEKILSFLERARSEGAPIVNPIAGVRNTYRTRTIPLLEKHKVPMPKGFLVKTSVSFSALPWGRAWIKRGDVHNTQKGDVSLVAGASEAARAVRALADRGIPDALIQEHVDGDLIKFYGIGDPALGSFWFRWFYHKNQDLKRHPFSEKELQDIIRAGARALGLEIFGGDAIVVAGGRIVLIDLNAWPSFALFREEASGAIARFLFEKIRAPKLEKV